MTVSEREKSMVAGEAETGIRLPESRGVSRRAASILQSFFLALGIVFLSLLSVSSTFLTVYMIRSEPEEQAIISMAGLVPTLVCMLSFAAIVVIICAVRITPPHQSTERFAFVLGTLLSAMWVFIANVGPAFDSLDLASAAFALGDEASVPTAFTAWYSHGIEMWGIEWTSGAVTEYCYMARYPFQAPFVLLLRSCQLIAGNKFHTFLELLNAISNGISWLLVCRIARELSGDDRASVVALGLCLTFTPLVYTSTFVYGNLISLPFALGAWLICILSSKADVSPARQFLCLVICSVLLALSTLVKQTMQIVSIAFAICVLMSCLRTKRWLCLPLAILPFVITSVLMNAILNGLEAKTGTDLHNAPPKTTWIVMGIGGGSERLAEHGDGTLPARDLEWPGFYDTYVWSDPHSEGYASWDDFNAHYLQLRLKRFAQNPAYAAKFFVRKLAIEWLEPTCECFLISNHEINAGQFASYLADTSREYTAFAPLFYYGPINTVSVTLADAFQSLAAIGSLLWCWGAWRKEDEQLPMQLLALILVLGSALLYLFWENKSQYILPYWLFLLPYAACGWFRLGQRVTSLFRKDAPLQ